MNLAKSTAIPLDVSKGQKFTLVGRSRAGDGTSFGIPELKWMFDCGALVQGWKPRRIFITHGHSDHVHFLPHMKNANNPPPIHLPEELSPHVQGFFRAHQAMSDCMSEDESQNGGKYEEDYTLQPTKSGEQIEFSQGGNQFIVHILKMEHRVPCIGYSIFKLQKALKKEYVGLPGKEIGNLRKNGVEVNEIKEEPFLCFMGDTTHAVFERHPEIFHHKLVVVECSFIDEGSIERAKTTKHMHWFDLKPYVEANPDTTFVLIHFSLKYSSLKIRQFFRQEQETLPNVHPLLLEEEVEQEWKKANPSGDGEYPKCKSRLSLGKIR
ncbi:unnamed protein product [Cylindrotheca closterium]|uniref:Metallo-beta-lactamase domain-containing protein n=1 Tax=Cylindrotheca closterium TaxID=2856 RepID=A0AAD2CLK4_9STRA|nr:unnamed protein product [Cylindrotheca closterium]